MGTCSGSGFQYQTGIKLQPTHLCIKFPRAIKVYEHVCNESECVLVSLCTHSRLFQSIEQ